MIDGRQTTAQSEARPQRITITSKAINLGIVATVIYLGVSFCPIALALLVSQIHANITAEAITLDVHSAKAHTSGGAKEFDAWLFEDGDYMLYEDGEPILYGG